MLRSPEQWISTTRNPVQNANLDHLRPNSGFPGGSDGEESTCNVGDPTLGQEDLLEKGIATQPVFLPGEFCGQEESGELQSMASLIKVAQKESSTHA